MPYIHHPYGTERAALYTYYMYEYDIGESDKTYVGYYSSTSIILVQRIILLTVQSETILLYYEYKYNCCTISS